MTRALNNAPGNGTLGPRPAAVGPAIVLAHGGGGQLTDELLGASILPRLGNAQLNQLLDSAVLASLGNDRPALTIDSYVVQPWRFPGGNIGHLAVCGTVNDLAVCGAEPVAIALSLILTEGFAMADLDEVLEAVAQAAHEAKVPIATGDTKVVGRAGAGAAPDIYITTAGVGRVPAWRELSPQRVRPGDKLLLNGPIGEHGLAVMLAREMPEVQSVLTTDAAPLNHLVRRVLDGVGSDVVFLRDATRSGLAGVAADLARDSGLHVRLEEAVIPVRLEARHAADMLGLDPLEIANEGKVVAVVRPGAADEALRLMQSDPLGRAARLIGEVGAESDGICEIHTTIGGRRILQKPYGEQLPRIC